MKLNMKLPNCLQSKLKLGTSVISTKIKIQVSLFALINLMSITSSLAHYKQEQQQQQAHHHHHHHHHHYNHNQNHQEPMTTNEIITSTAHEPLLTNFSQFSRDVTNLRLQPDLRSIKLIWTYEHNDTNRPESFKIRYCELTSWMAEIKCRHKDIQVNTNDAKLKQQQQQQQQQQQRLATSQPFVASASASSSNLSSSPSPPLLFQGAIQAPAINSTTVIKQQQHQQEQEPLKAAIGAAVHGEHRQTSGDSSSSSNSAASGLVSQTFETQIYDLRALTNYTFYVNVLHFVGEPLLAQAAAKALEPTLHRQQRPSRRLDLVRGRDNELLARTGAGSTTSVGQLKMGALVETTKPFSAEAVKCLAGSSEVLVNTGRYFGGRISVEGQQDARCQLLGNKSSEQTVYSFHIDHEICHSKIMDGNRIETMILVHENKEILTHNTARFLVLCNIAQKSFTVKASVSLPKVMNSLSQAFGGNSNSNHNNNVNNNYNHLSQYSRQATITSLPGKPLMQQQFTENGNFDRVRLGSMPGIYRLIRADSSAPYLPAPPTSAVTSTLSAPQPPTGSSSIDQTDNELSATVSSSRIAPDGHSQSNSTFNHKQLQAIENQLSHMESSVVSAPTIANASALALLSSSSGDTSSSSSPSSFARQAKELQPFKSSGTSGVAAAVATTTTTTAATTGPLGDSNTASSLELLQSMDELSLSPASTSTARHMQAWQFKRQQDELVLPKPVEVSSKILFVERASSGSAAAAAGAAAASATGGADLTRAAIMPVSQREARLYHASDQLQHNYQQQLQQQQVLSLSSLSSPPSPSSAGRAKQPYQQEQVARSSGGGGGGGGNAPLASGRRRQQLATSDTMAAGQRQAPIVRTGANLEKSKAALSMAATDIGDDESLAPIIMTNNHRIAGDYLALSQLADMKQQHQEQQQQQGQVRRPTETLLGEPQVESNFSIKYSASRVDDYSLGKLATTNLPATIDESSDHNHNDDGHDHDKSTGRSMSTTNVAFLAQPPLPPSPPPPITSQAARSRSGRMRQIASVASPPPPASLSDKLLATKMTSASSGTAVDFESRMGDAIHATAPNGGESDSAGQRQSSLVGADLLVGDASNRSEQVVKRVTSSSLGDEQVAANATIASQPPFQQQQQHSLAHNITGALIRWSLKTLGNLARKSLESLVVVDEPAPNRLDSFAGRTLFSSTLAPLVADSSLPPSMRQNISHRSNATTRLQLSAPGKLATNALAIESNGQLGSKPQPTTDHDDNQLDGFLINRSATLDHNPARVTSTITPKQLLVSSGTSTNSLPATTVLADSSARQARQQSNTSSTPLQANLQQPLATTTTTLRTTTSTPMPPLSPNVRFRHRSRQFQLEAQATPENGGRDKQQQQQQTEVKASEPVDSMAARSLWPIYAFCALICLIALIMVAFFFVLVPNRGRQHEPLSAAYQQQAPPPTPPKVFTGKSLLARLNETLRKNAAQHASSSNFNSNWPCPAVIDQTKVGPACTTNCTNGQISSKQLMLVRGSNLTSSRNSVVCHERSGQFANMSPSLSGSSATTRSTSAASTSCSSSMGGENCNNNNSNSNKNKNSEQFVVYTDYLLLNDDDDNNNDDDNDRASLATGQDAYCSQTMQRSSRRLPSESFA